MDDWKSEEECLAIRQDDEKLDWQNISAADLNRCFSSYSYLDAEGLRFYLPAMMTHEIIGDYLHAVGDRLSSDFRADRYHFLNSEQRNAIIWFLNWCLLNEDYTGTSSEVIVECLLNGHWKEI